MPAGRLKSFFPEKGFGFIGPDDGSKDVYCHARQFPGGDAKSVVSEGTRVVYEAYWDEQRGKMQAKSWDLETGGATGGQPNYAAMAQQSFGGDRSSPYGGAPGALPPGWETANDPTSGKAYYFNRATNETRWDPPPQAAPAFVPVPQPMATPQLAPGWESAQDPASGKTYYFNRATNETRWDPPLGVAAAPVNPMAAAPAGCAAVPNMFGAAPAGFSQPAMAPMQTAAPVAAAPGQLPPGWESAVDPASQKTYYFNRATNETKWEFPA